MNGVDTLLYKAWIKKLVGTICETDNSYNKYNLDNFSMLHLCCRCCMGVVSVAVSLEWYSEGAVPPTVSNA